MAQKEKVLKLSEKTVVLGTGKSFLEKGKEYSMHPELAKKLIKKGSAEAKK